MGFVERFSYAVPAALIIFTCAGCASVKENESTVCCESFGYGARMAECCSTFAWAKPEECKVPPGMVGGGKRVVDSERCSAR